MSQASIIPSLQSDALVREIEQQLRRENDSIVAGGERDAAGIVAQSRAVARGQVHESVEQLRAEGRRRLARAKAQLETEARIRAQRQAAKAVQDALPLLHEALGRRWRDGDSRKQWADAVARLAATRLPRNAWTVEHPKDWSSREQQQFSDGVGNSERPDISFKADDTIVCGLRIKCDRAVLDATPQGLLADAGAIAALLLDEIGGGGS